MPGRKTVFALCLICFVCSGSRAQQPVPPPPKPVEDAPNLEVTMKFIEEKMNNIGLLTWNQVASDDVTHYTEELTNIVADPKRCSISFHHRVSFGTEFPTLHSDFVIDLKSVEEITVESLQKNWNAQGNTRFKVSPPMYWIDFHKKYKGLSVGLLVDDEKLANRLARAITHAVELCSPEKKEEPF